MALPSPSRGTDQQPSVLAVAVSVMEPRRPGGTGGIPNSIAVKFDTYNNAGEGIDSTGLYTNGSSPTTPNSIDLTPSGIDLHSDDTMVVQLAYDGTTLSMVINDPVANTTFSTSWPINIPNTVGGPTAYVDLRAAPVARPPVKR